MGQWVQCQENAVDEQFQGRIFKDSNANGKRVSAQWDCKAPWCLQACTSKESHLALWDGRYAGWTLPQVCLQDCWITAMLSKF